VKTLESRENGVSQKNNGSAADDKDGFPDFLLFLWFIDYIWL